MVERLVFLGASTQVMLRLAPGALLQAVVPNDGTEATLSQGTPVHVFLAPDVLRVLGGATRDVPVAERGPAPGPVSSGLAPHPAPQGRRRSWPRSRSGPPLLDPHHPRLHQFQPVEEARHLGRVRKVTFSAMSLFRRSAICAMASVSMSAAGCEMAR